MEPARPVQRRAGASPVSSLTIQKVAPPAPLTKWATYTSRNPQRTHCRAAARASATRAISPIPQVSCAASATLPARPASTRQLKVAPPVTPLASSTRFCSLYQSPAKWASARPSAQTAMAHQ